MQPKIQEPRIIIIIIMNAGNMQQLPSCVVIVFILIFMRNMGGYYTCTVSCISDY